MKASAGMRNRISLLSGALLALIPLCGCETREGIVFTPTYIDVTWQQLWADAPALGTNGFQLAVQSPTRGLFPASIAVARLAVQTDGLGERSELVLDMTPEVDFLSWNSVFDELRSISEVFPLNQIAMNGSEINSANVIDAAAALEAKLCLIYTEIQPNLHEAEMRGVLVDVPERRLVAALRWRSFVVEPIPWDERYPTSVSGEEIEEQEKQDPQLQSVHRFQSSMEDCLLALMANDLPSDRIQPEGWVPSRPLGPAIWPPIEDRGIRRWYEDEH